jgi:trimethylamine--corrinoid protein Co-methyltransferase
VTLADALDGYDMVSECVAPADTPASAGNLRLFVEMQRCSLKPSDFTVMTAHEVRVISQIAAVVRGGQPALREKPLTAIDVAMISPLRCAADQTQALLECARWGLPIEVLTSPALAVSGPITLAGSVTLALAECLAALCLVYLVAPGLGIINAARVQPINMRSTATNYGAPELGMASVLLGACCARYRLPSNLYGLGTCAHLPGAQCEMEKSFSGLLMALGRPHMITGSAILDNGLSTSPEQLVVDHEAIRFIKRIRQPIVVDDDALGVAALQQGIRQAGVMLAEEHTLKYLKAGELLNCSLGQWDAYDQWADQGMPDLFERAHRQVEKVLGSHHVPPFDHSTAQAIERILEDAHNA